MENFWGAIKDKLETTRHNLTHTGLKESLGFFSMALVLLLDLFILFAIFEGLSDHTKQLARPYQIIPQVCREVAIQEKWTDEKRLNNLSYEVLKTYKKHSDPDIVPEKIHPHCRPLIESLAALDIDDEANRETTQLFETRRKITSQYYDVKHELEKIKPAYDTILLEQMANEKSATANLEQHSKEFRELSTKLSALSNRLKQIDARLNAAPKVTAVWSQLAALKNYNESLKADLERLEFLAPLKRLAMQLLFLIPLIALFYFWNSRSRKKESGLQTLVSSHLLIVSLIPLLLHLFEAIYKIIPKHLLKALWEFLSAAHLIALWHYALIFLVIAAALLCIYIVQKKIFNMERLLEKRIAKGRCQECGKEIPAGASACPFCGFAQYCSCAKCGKQTYVYGKHCRECGAENLK